MSYTDWFTKQPGSMTVTISPRVVGKSYQVSGLMTPAYITANKLEAASVEARFVNGKIVFYCGKLMIENPNLVFCGFTKGTDTEQPSAMAGPATAGLEGTYSDGAFALVNNGDLTDKNELQGYLWYNNNGSGGRADVAVPIDIKFTKVSETAAAPVYKAPAMAVDAYGIPARFSQVTRDFSSWRKVNANGTLVPMTTVETMPMSKLR